MTHRFRIAVMAAALLAVPSLALAQWDTPNRAFHKATLFPLDGRHLTVACASCHINGVVKGTPTTCYDCHWVRRQDDLYRTRLGTACEQCHRPTAWSAVKWDHAAQAGMALNGAHKLIGCEGCHKNKQFTNASSSCITCHQKDFNATTTPNHQAAGFPTTCETCHRASDTTFSTGRFNHNSTFPLVGVHAAQGCESCHANNRFQGTPTSCVGCHRTNYERTTNPNHAAAGMATTCENCHRATDASWGGTSSFNHNQFFPLVGLHATQVCSACHIGAVYKGTRTDCAGCHMKDFTQAQTPNHVASGFSTACDSCHKATDPSWRGAGFNHNSVFPLVGLHGTATCTACHVNGVYKGTSRDCFGCHQKDFTQAQTPNHVASGFSTACDSCHKATDPSWRGANFNHNSVFALVGLHATATCSTCHINGVYKGTSRDCVGCHRSAYDQSKNPNHAAAGFSTTCDSCHRATDSSWLTASLNHNQFFPLVGQHIMLNCGACHINNVYRGTPRACYPCHQTKYDQTTTPSHTAARFPTTCETCHKATDAVWTLGKFNHTAFPITSGAHRNNACTACHTNPANYSVFTCTTCHERTSMDNKHKGRTGYAYDSNRCYACHPNGRAG